MSGNRLDHYSRDPNTAIGLLIESFNLLKTLNLNEDQRFVWLTVDDIKDSILRGGGADPSVVFKPEAKNPSHVAISWGNWPQHSDVIAGWLLVRALDNGVYSTVPESPA